MIRIIVLAIVLLAVIGGGALLINQGRNQDRHTQGQSRQNQTPQIQISTQESYGGYGFKKPFYEKDGVSLQHYWPGEGSFSNEETEILLFNDTSSQLQVKSLIIDYQVEGRSYLQKSGTWEKFPSKQSWDKIEYLNISPQYYKSEPLILTPGQKGKLHWHINFGSNRLDGKQTVTVKITLLKGNETITVDEEFNRDSGTVMSKDNH